ncbi:MAG TPA: glycosyltransferase [Streptosporangiaceae bacterium]|nr:glycosyltransferase [Streptosporangiaceae bacterium]
MSAGRDGASQYRAAGAGPGPLRIATIITRLEGGSGQHALRGIRALDRSEFEPLVITGSAGRLADQAADDGIAIRVTPWLRETIAPASDLRAVGRLTALLGELRPDVVHTHCAKAGAIGRLAARNAGTARIVHTYHGFPFHEFQSPARRNAYVAVERRLGRITDLGLCVGTAVAVEAIRRRLLPPERVVTIGVPIDGEACGMAGVPRAADPMARDRARARLGLAAGSVVVGAVGRLTYQKAPEDFVAALRALGRPGVTGVWVGGGELASSVRDFASAAGQDIVWAGDRTDVAELLPGFDVFALPSRYEGLPTAVAEAMACGVPVVATAVNAVADLVEPGVTGLLVPPGSPEALASAIGHLLDVPGRAAALAAAASSRVGARYGARALGDALAAAYRPGMTSWHAGAAGRTTSGAGATGPPLAGETNVDSALPVGSRARRKLISCSPDWADMHPGVEQAQPYALHDTSSQPFGRYRGVPAGRGGLEPALAISRLSDAESAAAAMPA